MTTTTLTLTEFLLARIAEDEVTLPTLVDDHLPIETAYGPLDWPARVRREVDAKRRIMDAAEEASGLDMQVDSEFAVGPRDEATEPYVGDVILRHLASVYADHPDYREEWVA